MKRIKKIIKRKEKRKEKRKIKREKNLKNSQKSLKKYHVLRKHLDMTVHLLHPKLWQPFLEENRNSNRNLAYSREHSVSAANQ